MNNVQRAQNKNQSFFHPKKSIFFFSTHVTSPQSNCTASCDSSQQKQLLHHIHYRTTHNGFFFCFLVLKVDSKSSHPLPLQLKTNSAKITRTVTNHPCDNPFCYVTILSKQPPQTKLTTHVSWGWECLEIFDEW